jgi:hypothetical protein
MLLPAFSTSSTTSPAVLRIVLPVLRDFPEADFLRVVFFAGMARSSLVVNGFLDNPNDQPEQHRQQKVDLVS